MMIEAISLCKTYQAKGQKINALKSINFNFENNDHLAIIGPNGSGKTTLIKLLTQISHPTSGQILLKGQSLSAQDKGCFGLMLGTAMLYHRLSVIQNLRYYAALYDVPKANERIFELLKTHQLAGKANDYVEDLSEGMKSKLAFCRAVLHKPDILILDEPTTGLDPVSTDQLYQEIQKYPNVIFSTHNLHEVAKLANKVLVLNHGKAIFFGSIRELTKSDKVEKVVSGLRRIYDQ